MPAVKMYEKTRAQARLWAVLALLIALLLVAPVVSQSTTITQVPTQTPSRELTSDTKETSDVRNLASFTENLPPIPTSTTIHAESSNVYAHDTGEVLTTESETSHERSTDFKSEIASKNDYTDASSTEQHQKILQKHHHHTTPVGPITARSINEQQLDSNSTDVTDKILHGHPPKPTIPPIKVATFDSPVRQQDAREQNDPISTPTPTISPSTHPASHIPPPLHAYTREERIALSEEVREMFAHAFNGYIEYAHPADELKPLSCTPRSRREDDFRGDVDRCMGNYSLTLIDSLDTLAVMGDIELFYRAIDVVATTVTFDTSVIVSVFEVTIRVLGGLLSAHCLALDIQATREMRKDIRPYDGSLLPLAVDLADRLLVAFNTPSGLPMVRVDLRHGPLEQDDLYTCTACAGTMLLEFATLSRLTGEPVYEEKARHAFVTLFNGRYYSGLVGRVYNIVTGEPLGAHAGVGASIDSYYEYILKAYIVTGDDGYLHMWDTHYHALIQNGTRGCFFVDCDADKPMFMKTPHLDALQAFFPGLQVLAGDIPNARWAWQALYRISKQNHHVIPEVFSRDGSPIDPHYLLRPEFIESTYMLYTATKSNEYIQVGVDFMKSLNTRTRTQCGFAALKNITSGEKLDRMDSFFLAETLKYLYLLFRPHDMLPVDLTKYVATTEAHLLPLRRPKKTPTYTLVPLSEVLDDYVKPELLTCPNGDWVNRYALLEVLYGVRMSQELDDRMGVVTTSDRDYFIANFEPMTFKISDHVMMQVLESLGIWVVRVSARLELVYAPGLAVTLDDKVLGLQVMNAFTKVAAAHEQQNEKREEVVFMSKNLRSLLVLPEMGSTLGFIEYPALQAAFGEDITAIGSITGNLILAEPDRHEACVVPKPCYGCILLVKRGSCTFVNKVLNAQRAGAIAVVVADTDKHVDTGLIHMSHEEGELTDAIHIPSVFITRSAAHAIEMRLISSVQMVEIHVAEAENVENH
eukprot:CFRG1377T1